MSDSDKNKPAVILGHSMHNDGKVYKIGASSLMDSDDYNKHSAEWPKPAVGIYQDGKSEIIPVENSKNK